MDPFHLFIKTKHDLNSLNIEAFSQIENEILEVFGGVKALLTAALKSRHNIDYNTLLKLSEILQSNTTSTGYKNAQKCEEQTDSKDDSTRAERPTPPKHAILWHLRTPWISGNIRK